MDLDSIGNITDFVRQCLKDRKIESAEITKAVLVTEEAVSLVMGIGPTIGMFLCMSNCLGDMVVTTIVAKQAGLMDMKVYRN